MDAEQERYLDAFLWLQWLRPENLPWDVAAATLIAPYLLGPERTLEIGIGPGYTTFLYLGGAFEPDFDWYLNARVDGFWKNEDIYDADELHDLARYVAKRPVRRLTFALDHKANLIEQAQRLGLAEDYLVADAATAFAFPPVDLVYSNMLYWLSDPRPVLARIHDRLPTGGRCVLVFPSDVFYEYCRSYRRDTPMWTLLNRGRADTLMWTMSLDEFMRDVAGPAGFALERHAAYCSRDTMRFWDIGLRPLSPPLIRMANALDPDLRLAVKREWCETLRPILTELVENELEDTEPGAYNFVVLARP